MGAAPLPPAASSLGFTLPASRCDSRTHHQCSKFLIHITSNKANIKSNKKMGKAKDGILGAITGKVRNLVWYKRGNENLVRVIGKRFAKLTDGELVNTGKMRVLMEFFESMKPFLKAGFSNSVKGTNWNYHNMATSYNRINVAGLSDGLQHLDYGRVLLSMGTALEPLQPAFVLEGHELRYSWAWDSQDYAAAEDQVMMLVYMPDQNFAVFETAGAKRKAGADLLPMLPSYLQQRMEVFISFISKDRDRVANSVYLGRLN